MAEQCIDIEVPEDQSTKLVVSASADEEEFFPAGEEAFVRPFEDRVFLRTRGK